MPASEKFSLKWNDFQDNVKSAFAALRKDSEFTDVTLVCKDGHQVEAHKVILAASSPFFQNILKRNKHAHPLIYMRKMKSEDLLSVDDFLYFGEANIYQDNLDAFLNIAEELELKGLTQGERGGREREENNESPSEPIIPSTGEQKKNDTVDLAIGPQSNEYFPESYCQDQIPSSMTVALPKQEYFGNIIELDQKIETMISRVENTIRHGPKGMFTVSVCKVCGKEGQKSNIKDHIEANHMEGIAIPCNFCERTFRSRSALRHHNSRSHTSSIL